MASTPTKRRVLGQMERVESLGTVLSDLLRDDKRAVQAKQLHSVCYALGYFLTDDEVAQALKRLDPSGSGSVEVGAFIKWWAEDDRFDALQLPQEEMQSMLKCVEYFQYFDRSGDGVLDLAEFEALHADLHKRGVTQSDFDTTLKEMASRNDRSDNQISFAAYVSWMVEHGELKAKLPKAEEAKEDSYTDTTDDQCDDDDDDDDDDCFDEEEDDDAGTASTATLAPGKKVERREVSMILDKARMKADAEKLKREEEERRRIALAKQEAAKERVAQQPKEKPAIEALIDHDGLNRSVREEAERDELGKGKQAAADPAPEHRLNFSNLDGQSPEAIADAREHLAPRKGTAQGERQVGCKHLMKKYHFSSPTWCTVCGKFLWGLGKQGYLCTLCGDTYHPGECVLEQVSQTSRILKAGWLYKIGSAKKDAETGKWQKRFFVLSNDYLLYFKTSKKKELLGALPVTASMCSRSEGDGSPTGFVIDAQGRVMHLRAISKQDLESWNYFVEKAAAYHK